VRARVPARQPEQHRPVSCRRVPLRSDKSHGFRRPYLSGSLLELQHEAQAAPYGFMSPEFSGYSGTYSGGISSTHSQSHPLAKTSVDRGTTPNARNDIAVSLKAGYLSGRVDGPALAKPVAPQD
jgi:hypothetical protein